MISNKKIVFFSAIIIIVAVIALWLVNQNDGGSINKANNFIKTMTIKSSAFNNDELIPAKYTCDGENINPPLEISNVPEDAKSLALVVDDPDSPSGTWVHWTLWNINSNIKKIEANNVPNGAQQGITSFKQIGYGGPCPTSSLHHYQFKLYALSAISSLATGATVTELQNFIDSHTLAQAELIGIYLRRP